MSRFSATLFPIVFLAGLIAALSGPTTPPPAVRAAGQPQMNVIADARLVLAGSSAVADRTLPSRVRQDAEIASLDFEATTFPPEGWTLLDNVNRKTGRESRQAWSRQGSR